MKYIRSRKNTSYPAGIDLYKINSGNIRMTCEIYSNLTIKIPKRRQWHGFGVCFVNFKQISHVVFMFPSLNWNEKMPAG